MKGACKWSLLIFVALLAVVNYYALVDSFQHFVVEPFDRYLLSVGYHFSIEAPFDFFFDKLIPGLSIIAYFIKIFEGKEILDWLNRLYEMLTFAQLLVLAILLPILLFLQNNVYGKVQSIWPTTK